MAKRRLNHGQSILGLLLPALWLLTEPGRAAEATPPPPPSPTPWFNRAWQSDEGLPDNTVVAVGQTPDGFLWVATQAGLVRFDGLQFHQFAVGGRADGPPSLIQAMLVDRRGRLWLAGDRQAVVCVDGGRVTTVAAGTEQANLEARLMLEDATGSIWVSYIGGEVHRFGEGGRQSYSARDGLTGGGTCQLATDRDGGLWYAEGGVLGKYAQGRFTMLEKFRAQRIAPARAGGLWICTARQVFRFQTGAPPVRVADLPVTGGDVNPTVLYEDRAGGLWIGTREAGLFCWRNGQIQKIPTSHQEILSLFEDAEGNFWVGTRGGGLNRLQPRVVELLAPDPAVPFEGIRSVCEDRQGRLWAVGESGKLFQRTAEGWHALTAAQGWPVPYALCVAPDAEGGVWIGTQYLGLYHWRGENLATNLNRTTGLGGDLVGALLPRSDGTIWLGTQSVDGRQHTLEQRGPGAGRVFVLPGGSGPVAALAADAAGDVWAGTSGGMLLRVHQDALLAETGRTVSGRAAIRSLYPAPDGSLWIGYAGAGVGWLQAGRFAHFGQEQGLPDDYISQILEDGRGWLWFAGNRGIFQVRAADLAQVAAAGGGRLQSVAYGQNEGLPRLQAGHEYFPGAWRAGDGELWFAMQSGLARVHAANRPPNPTPPRVVIEGLRSNGQTLLDYGAGALVPTEAAAARFTIRGGEPEFRLPPGQRQVDLFFTALSFTLPEAVGFRYRLAGQPWVEAGAQRVASYPQLSPGTHHFQVEAVNSDGVRDETGAGLTLVVVPEWWETLWFQVAAPLTGFALLGGGLLDALRRRHRRQIERLELLQATERERARIAQDLHDDLGAGLTQISLNSAMVQNPAVAPEVVAGMLQEIDQRAHELVTALDEIVWAVNPKNDTVPSLARYLCQFAQHCLQPGEITCRLEVAAALPNAPVSAEQRHQLFLAFKEALHNTLRHSGATELRLAIAGNVRAVTITLADNGRGFVPGPPKEGEDGLANMRSRLERLGGSCQITTAPGAGTVVTFELPLLAGIRES